MNDPKDGEEIALDAAHEILKRVPLSPACQATLLVSFATAVAALTTPDKMMAQDVLLEVLCAHPDGARLAQLCRDFILA